MSDLKTVGDLCEALANPTPASVQRKLEAFDKDHPEDPCNVLTPASRPPDLGLRFFARGESVMPDVPEDWLVVGGDVGGFDWGMHRDS